MKLQLRPVSIRVEERLLVEVSDNSVSFYGEVADSAAPAEYCDYATGSDRFSHRCNSNGNREPAPTGRIMHRGLFQWKWR